MRARRTSYRTRAFGLALGFAADAVLADPARWHPVAGYGQAAAALEQRLWRDRRAAGAAFALIGVGTPALLGHLITTPRFWRGNVVSDVSPPKPEQRPGWWAVLAMAAATWTALGATSLAREGSRLARLLDAGELDAARSRLRYLCARDASDLDASELARATVESLAENTSDAVTAPLAWGLIAGIPGVLAYRAVNTLDAMVGYHNQRYERFGWCSARLDDLANLGPARLTAVLTVALAPTVGGSRSAALAVLRRDGGRHPSPNAGHCEAAFAGALGVRLGGVNRYGDQVEARAGLGDGAGPTVADIARAVRLSRLVGLAVAGLVTAIGLMSGRRRSSSPAARR